jgi:NitT/TauT family transport system ATP-binding protein
MVTAPARGSFIGGIGWRLEEVSIVLGGRRIVEQCSTQAAAGSATVLVGPSGCGKTTLLRALGELIKVQAGHISHRSANGAELARGACHVSFCFQEPRLLPWLSALDNAALPLSLAGVPREDARARAAVELSRTGLADAKELLPRALSGGMQMRVALARALVTTPNLLLLDEPFAALDELRRMQLDEALRALHAELGFTMVFVTHSSAEAAFIGDRVLVMGTNARGIVADLAMSASARNAAHRTREEFAHDLARIERALHSQAEVP